MTQAYDYIIVGAGSAGCVIASRLSEDLSLSVLLVEAGGSDGKLTISMPAALPFVYQDKRISWGYESGPEPQLGGKTVDEKAGRVIGGTSSINAMIYNRGNPLDYDGWASMGLPEWDFAHCLPYFQKMETFSEGADAWRGGHGPMHVNRCRAEHKLYDAFLRGGEQAGFEVAQDHNGYKQEGVHVAQASIRDGRRWSSAQAYLHPVKNRPNLHIIKNALVEKVVIENGSAVGIKVANSDAIIHCEREIILSAGAYNSPKLLMLSGVGDPDTLRSHRIPVVADLKGVGRDLQNHPGVDLQYATSHEDSLTSQLSLLGQAKLGAQWLLTKKGLGASNLFETGAFLRTRDDVAFPNVQYEFLPLARQLKNGKLIPIPGFQFWMDLSRPASRGEVTLRSANPADPPSIVFNHMESRQDVRDMIDAIRLARKLIYQPAWEKYRRAELTPGPDVVSDSEIEAFIRQSTASSYHPSSSCRMGIDAMAVVDGEGRVRSVDGLRVVDASIMPKSVTANLNAPTMMMAEKISDRILGKAPLAASDADVYR